MCPISWHRIIIFWSLCTNTRQLIISWNRGTRLLCLDPINLRQRIKITLLLADLILRRQCLYVQHSEIWHCVLQRLCYFVFTPHDIVSSDVLYRWELSDISSLQSPVSIELEQRGEWKSHEHEVAMQTPPELEVLPVYPDSCLGL